MRKLFLLLLMAVVFCGNAQAQKGMHGIGVNGAGVSVGGKLSMGGGLKYQYNISNYVRIEPSLTVYSRSINEDGNAEEEGYDMVGLVNLDVFLLKPHAIRPYLFAGLGFANGTAKEEYEYEGGYFITDPLYYFSGIGANAGLGIDWRITPTWSLQIECGVLGVVTASVPGCKFNIGLCYNL